MNAFFGGGATSFGYLLCAVLYPLAALAALRGKLDDYRKTGMLICCLVTAAWGIAMVAALSGTIPGAVAIGLELLRSACWLAFFVVSLFGVMRLRQKLRSLWGAPLKSVAVLALLIGLISVAFTQVSAPILISFWQISVSIASLLMLENLLRNCDDESRWGVRLICLGAGPTMAYDLFYYVTLLVSSELDVRFILARGYIAALGAPLLIFPMVKARNWRGDIALSRRFVFHSAALAGAGFYLLSTSLIGEYLRSHNDTWGTGFEIAFLVTAVVILMVVLQSASARAQLMVFISKHFFRLKYDYRTVWLSFIRQMGNTEAHKNLHERTLRSVADAINCRCGVLWALQHPIQAYVPVATWNALATDHPMIHVEEDLPKFLSETGWIVDIPHCVKDPEFYSGLEVPRWLQSDHRMWILIPLIHNQLLEGFLVLGSPQPGPFPLGWEDFDVMKTVGAQAASYLAEERASRELVDARRLADLNRRFAFILHDIKNVVSQMAMMLQNAERFGDNPEFQKDMLGTVANAVDRLREMLVQLGSNDRSIPRVPPREIELAPVVIEAVKRWQKSVPALTFSSHNGSPIMVSAIEDRLATSLNHLIQNAVEAIGPEGGIHIAMTCTPTDGIIEIIDNGPGMTSEFIRDQLFRPLETSKPNGSGIGAFQALKNIRDMGGRLDVDSEFGRGTTMRIRLKRTDVDSQNRGILAHANGLDR